MRSKLRLVLFFTRGMSLKAWDEVGMFDREVALYAALLPHVRSIDFLTYGGPEEREYTSRLDGIGVLCNAFGLPSRHYERLIPLLHARALCRATVLKTNQTMGADVALAAARLHGKPLVARCGYLWSLFAWRAGGAPGPEFATARRTESYVFRRAARVVVSSEAARRYILGSYRVWGERVRVIPNYVSTERFLPLPELRDAKATICFVGRLDEQKNLPALLEAARGLDVRLHLIGDGPARPLVERLIGEFALDAALIGRVPHEELPRHLNRATLFVLPSRYEGHPKTLLEAMSCGLPVIGADAPGIREVIAHGRTGLLCGGDAASLRLAIEALLAAPRLRDELGRNARAQILATCALERIAAQERALLHEVAEHRRRVPGEGHA
jgi:glycosyltransferase involved in cell wall biosynthesis